MTPSTPEPREVGGHALVVTDLHWGVGGLKIVDDVSLTIDTGEFVSVIGPNGAGKTSLINLISGVYAPRSGTVSLLGRDVTARRPAERTRLGLGRTFQTSSLFPGLTVHENVRIAAQAALGGSLSIVATPRDGDVAHDKARTALGRVGLEERSHERAADLSHGDKRKLELAMVMAADPAVLLLDEPTAGVSAEDTGPLVELIQRLHQAGTTIVMVEHRREVVVEVSDRIAVMHEGGLLTQGTPEAVMADATVRSAYLGGRHESA